MKSKNQKKPVKKKTKKLKFQNKNLTQFLANFSGWSQSTTVFCMSVFWPLWSTEVFGHSSTLLSVTFSQ